MQNNIMIEKKRVLWDNDEVPGLVSVDEIAWEKSVAEVPSFKRIREVQSDITKNPRLKFKYSLSRGEHVLKFFEDMHKNNEVKDCEIIRVDAHGVPFSENARKIYVGCECINKVEPKYDAGAPEYASITVDIIFFDVVYA